MMFNLLDEVTEEEAVVSENHLTASFLHDFRTSQQEVYKLIKKKFPNDTETSIEDILDDFSKEKNLFEAQKAINRLLMNVQDEQVFRVVKMVLDLLDEVTEEEVVVSENHLTASFVHVIMKAIFKKDLHVMPHM